MKKFKYKYINRYFYIYLRETKEKFNKKEVYKLGCTTNLYNRDNQYKTSEVNKKKFIKIIRFTPINIKNINKECKDIELEYQKQYKYCNIINNDGEKEFYKIGINTSISSFTKEKEEFEKYKPIIITDEKEIEQEIFNNRINPDSEENREFNKMFQSKINYINKFKKLKSFDGNVKDKIKEIYEHKLNQDLIKNNNQNLIKDSNQDLINLQINSFNTSKEFIKNNYLSGFQLETFDKMINYYKTNNKGILNICCRMGKTRISLCFLKYMKFNNIIVFVPANVLLKQWSDNIKLICPEYKIIIFNPLNKIKDKTIYLCYYGNSKYFINNYTYDLKIYDEFHHLTSINLEKTNKGTELRNIYINCLKVKSKYTLSLSATLKIIEKLSLKKVLSNDDKKEFGQIIDKRTFNDGLQNKRLCDFKVYIDCYQTEFNIKNQNEQFILKIQNAINSVIHIMFKENMIRKNIFFVNNINTIENICVPYINKIIKENNYELEVLKYHSKLNNEESKDVLKNFEKSKNAILFAVYGLSEGFDMPYLDSVCIGARMTTNIRITQSILRPTTFDKNNINKNALIILPCTFDYKDTTKTIKENKDYKKILSVLYQLTVLKINVFQKIIVKNHTSMSRKNIKSDTDEDSLIFSDSFLKSSLFQLLNIKYKYKDAIEKLKKYNIKSIDEYRHKFLEISEKLPEKPDKYYSKENFNWCDFLSINKISDDEMADYINDYFDETGEMINIFNISRLFDDFYKFLQNKNVDITSDKRIFIDTYIKALE